MRTKSLKNTNPYLQDPAKRKKGLWTTVSSSSAIEGVQIAKKKVIKKADETVVIPPHKSAKSAKSHR